MNKHGYRRSTNNFWQQKLIDSGVSLKDMSELLRCSYRYTVAYFSGFVHPSVDQIETICDFLDVPFSEGLNQFDKIHEAWGESHKDTYVRVGNTYKHIKDVKIKPLNSKRTFKLGFWNHKIAGSDWTYSMVAEKLGKAVSTVKAYFSGFILPDTDVIKNICIMFNVDYDRGYQEFIKAHEGWGEAHSDTYEKVGNSYRQITQPKTPTVVTTPKVVNTTKSEHKSPNILDCQEKLYGKLSYDDFMYIESLTTSHKDLLRFVFDKVDFDTFMDLL